MFNESVYEAVNVEHCVKSSGRLNIKCEVRAPAIDGRLVLPRISGEGRTSIDKRRIENVLANVDAQKWASAYLFNLGNGEESIKKLKSLKHLTMAICRNTFEVTGNYLKEAVENAYKEVCEKPFIESLIEFNASSCSFEVNSCDFYYFDFTTLSENSAYKKELLQLISLVGAVYVPMTSPSLVADYAANLGEWRLWDAGINVDDGAVVDIPKALKQLDKEVWSEDEILPFIEEYNEAKRLSKEYEQWEYPDSEVFSVALEVDSKLQGAVGVEVDWMRQVLAQFFSDFASAEAWKKHDAERLFYNSGNSSIHWGMCSEGDVIWNGIDALYQGWMSDGIEGHTMQFERLDDLRKIEHEMKLLGKGCGLIQLLSIKNEEMS